MKLLALATAAALIVAACGGGAQPAPTTAATTAAPAAANQVVFTADLKPTNEVPPVTGAEASGSGKATVTLNLTRSAAGAITAATADFDVVLSGFPASTAITVGHLHKAAAGANGPVSVGIKTDQANPIALATGGTTITKTGLTVPPDVAQQIIDDPAGYYVNIHSAMHGGGLVRGQLSRQ